MRALFAIAVMIVIVALTSTAAADRKKAERLFRAGEKAYRAQNFLAAAQNFELAYAELPAPELAFSAAQAYRRQYRVDAKAEHVVAAIKYYELYLKEVKTGGRVGDAADSLGEMIRERDRLGGSGKLGGVGLAQRTLLGVSVQFADAQQVATKVREIEEAKAATTDPVVTLTIDGKPREVDTLHAVEPGDHHVRAEAAGYAPTEKRVRVIAGAQDSEELVLQPLPARITVTTEPGATVIVDGRGVGEAPTAAIPVAAGTHVITVVRAGRRAAAREVHVTRAQQLSLAIGLESTLRRRSVKWVAVSALVFTGLAAATAGGALYWDDQASESYALLKQGDQPPSVLADYNSARDLRDQSVGGIYLMGGTAVALGLAAAWLYHFDSPSAEGVKVVPAASPTAAGAVISARF